MTAAVETIVSPAEVLAFWRAAGPDKWFERDDAFDAEIREKFLPTYTAAAAGRLDHWQSTPDGTLALLVLLDQFPRNLFRGADRLFEPPERRFFHLPLMHSESLADQERCIALCREAGDAEGEKYAEMHADIVRRFGRFPHRNRALGRTDTDAERAFLEGGGFGGP